MCVECPSGYNASLDHSSCTNSDINVKEESWYKKPGYIGLLAAVCVVSGGFFIFGIANFLLKKAIVAPAAFVV